MAKKFKTRPFVRWLKKSGIANSDLCRAVDEMRQGLIDADLGGDLYKKRVAIGSKGKRGGARTIVAMNARGRWFFLYGFNKNERANINQRELMALQYLATDLLALSTKQLETAVEDNSLEEICSDDQDKER